MRALLICLMLVGCGKQQDTPTPGSPPPIAVPVSPTSPIVSNTIPSTSSMVSSPGTVVTLQPLVTSSSDGRVYIIAGQSNAERLLTTIHGLPLNVNSANYPNLDNTNTVGYAVDGTDIAFWLQPANLTVLQDLAIKYCATKPYFIWWQGEADSGQPNITTYQNSVTGFLTQIQNSCPQLQIVIVSLEVDTSSGDFPGSAQMENIQQNLGYPWISAKGYTMVTVEHLDQPGYTNFWAAFTAKFPL